MSFGNFLFGSRGKTRQRDLLSGGQQDLLDQLIQQIISGHGGFGFDEDFFQKSFVDPAMRQFESQIAPSIQQRYIGQGAQSSSGLQDDLLRAGADVQGGLDQKRAELLNQALNRQLQGAQTALGTKAFGYEQTPGETGLIPELFSGVAEGFGGSFGTGFGKEMGGRFGRRVGFR